MWVWVWICDSVLRWSLVVSNADALRICPFISFRVKIMFSLWNRETFILWIELASGLIWRGVQDGGLGLWWGMDDVNGQGEVSGPEARARVRVRFLESCRGMVFVRFDWGAYPSLGQLSNSVSGLQWGKGNIHGDGGGSGHRYVLGLWLGNR